ncbi:MAG: ABC transporter permease [Okeania sp. SIO3H1]|nr:ABC transporter permease [Okeania sp. SIO3H1]
MVNEPLIAPDAPSPYTPLIAESARLPIILPKTQAHAGILLGLAAATAGISVSLVRYLSVGFSGCLASLGGVYLALVHVKFFTEGMSSGKGFIALAAIIFGRWHPVNTVLACLLFGATEALQLRVQAFNLNIPYQFLEMLPYVIALLALIGLAGKSTPPAALGKRQ